MQYNKLKTKYIRGEINVKFTPYMTRNKIM